MFPIVSRCLVVMVILVSPGIVQADGFDPIGPRALLRELGIGLGPGYHHQPCCPVPARHFQRAVHGESFPAYHRTPLSFYNPRYVTSQPWMARLESPVLMSTTHDWHVQGPAPTVITPIPAMGDHPYSTPPRPTGGSQGVLTPSLERAQPWMAPPFDPESVQPTQADVSSAQPIVTPSMKAEDAFQPDGDDPYDDLQFVYELDPQDSLKLE